jgi:hypothetical protein
MPSSGMSKNKTKKQSDQDTLAEVTLEMAKPRVARSARERDTDSGHVTDDPMTDEVMDLRQLPLSMGLRI